MNTAASYRGGDRLVSEQITVMAFLKEQGQLLLNWPDAPEIQEIDRRVLNYHRHDPSVESNNLAILDELASLDIHALQQATV